MRATLQALLTFSLLATGVSAQEKPNLKDARQRASYAIGADIGNTFKRQQLDIDGRILADGIVDALAGKSSLTETEIRQAIEEFQKAIAEKAQAKDKAFLAANAKKEGVKTTASGLQYKVLKSGKGKTPLATETVKVHYTGTLIDGTVFDSSVSRGQPAEFHVNQVISGWTEALQLMKEGDKWQLVIPGHLAYGESGFGPQIGPNATLLFEIELLSVTK